MARRPCLASGPGPKTPGIDVSVHQGRIDWDAVAGASPRPRFVFIRSSVGMAVDDEFARNWREAKRVGIRRGAYIYLKAVRGGRRQADRMADAIEAAGGMKLGDLAPVVDIEEDYQTVDGSSHSRTGARMLSPERVARESLAALERLERRTGARPIVYTGQYFHWQIGQRFPELARRFAKYPLWVPSYTSCISMPADQAGRSFPWRDWTFWQYTSRGRLPGIPPQNTVDLNWFRGTSGELSSFALKSRLPTFLKWGLLGLGAAVALGGTAYYFWPRLRRR